MEPHHYGDRLQGRELSAMKIGIAGLGKMGTAMAGRLKGLGHEIIVWNRSADKARALGAAGMKVAASPAELASEAEIVITILTDAAAVDSVYTELLKGKVEGRLFIEMSTVRPESQKRLLKKVSAKGASLVECPVGGSVAPAREGKLFGFAGGAEADVARARPVLEQLCRRVEHVGPVGAGASMKLAINLPLMVYWQALGEALSLVKNLKLDPERVMSILSDTSGTPTMMKNRGPTIAAALAGKDTGAVSVSIDTMKKDLGEMVAEAKSLGYDAPVTAQTLRCFERASKAGLGAKDCVMLPVDWASEPKKL
jgi:3-hydroxyisobutyrate dehydrogenase